MQSFFALQSCTKQAPGVSEHIDGLEGFRGYLKRLLSSKRRTRTERLPLCLGEYVWMYNHRELKIEDKIHMVLSPIENRYKLSG